jgi:hypothetical protein
LSWLTDEGVEDVLGMKRANASGKEWFGRKRCREVWTSEATFYFHAVCLSIRKQFIPEQLLTATYALPLAVFSSVLKR